MKNVLLSADGYISVYSVPDMVAEHLGEYCMYFCTKWLPFSPDAQKYRHCIVQPGGRESVGLFYTEADFIDYLNQHVFPDTQSALVEDLELTDIDAVPETYRDCPWFNF